MKRIIIAGMLTMCPYIGANLAYLYMMPIGVLAAEGSDRADGDEGDRGPPVGWQ